LNKPGPFVRRSGGGKPQIEAYMSQLKQDLSELYDLASKQLFHCALAVTRSSDLAEDAVT